MYKVYVIKSITRDWIYVGLTISLERRLKEHNNKRVSSTKAYAPFELIFFEEFAQRIDARAREKYLKSGTGKEQIKNKINMPRW